MVAVALRWFVVVLLLVAFNTKTWTSDWLVLRTRLGYLLGMGAIGLSAFTAVFFIAAHYTTAINMGIIAGMLPVFVLIGSLIFFGVRVQSVQWIGAGITLVGVAVVATRGDPGGLLEVRVNAGDLLVCVAIMLYAGYALGLRKRPAVTATGLLTALSVAALLASVPLVAAEALLGKFQAPTLQGWTVVMLSAVFPTLLAQMMFMRGVAMIGPGRAGVFINLVPVFAAAIAVVYLNEDFHTYHGLALALVVGGIWLSERNAYGD